MTRLPLTSFLRNTGFYRPVILSNNCRRYLSEVSSQLSKAEPHDASHTAPHSSKPKEGSDPDASAPTLADEQPAKKKRKRTIKTVVAEGAPTLTTLTGGQINEDPKPKKEKKKETEKEKEAKRGKASLRPGEVLPEVPAGELPPIDLWRKYFLTEKASSQRCVVRKPETAAMLADIFVPEGSKDKIIIEASPGPGQLTRALLNLPKERVKKIYVLEPAKSYLKYLEPLEQSDPRVKIYPQHGREWEVYTKLRNDGAFDGVAQTNWNEVHPQLQFIMHMSTWVDGEQFLSQLFRCIPDSQWLFQYGRVPLNLILPTRMWERVNAAESSVARCKLSVIAQATADLQECVDPEALKPYKEHFHPELVYGTGPNANANVRGRYLEPRKLGTPHTAITVLPLKRQHIARGELDLWDYILRKLFVQKATSVQRCLNSNALGPGSTNLLAKLTERNPRKSFNTTKKGPRDLNIREWGILLEEFKNWPFRPQDLGIESFFESGFRIR